MSIPAYYTVLVCANCEKLAIMKKKVEEEYYMFTVQKNIDLTEID